MIRKRKVHSVKVQPLEFAGKIAFDGVDENKNSARTKTPPVERLFKKRATFRKSLSFHGTPGRNSILKPVDVSVGIKSEQQVKLDNAFVTSTHRRNVSTLSSPPDVTLCKCVNKNPSTKASRGSCKAKLKKSASFTMGFNGVMVNECALCRGKEASSGAARDSVVRGKDSATASQPAKKLKWKLKVNVLEASSLVAAV